MRKPVSQDYDVRNAHSALTERIEMSGTIFLEADELSIGEAEGAADVAIVRTGDLSQPVTIEFGITGVGATPGSDFDARTGTVTMAAGEDRAIVSARVFDDALAEQTEAFAVSIINVSSGTLLAPRTARVEILDDENPQSDPPSPPLTSPYNVAQDAVIGGLSQPIDFEFAPQDRNLVYVAEKAGVVKVANAETGSVVSTFMDISDQVNDRQDRGLLDIALDPNFPDNPFVYAFYVVDPPEAEGQSGNAGRDGGGNRYAYVSRFEADATNDFLTVVPGSETVILGGAGQSLSDISGGGAVDSTSARNQAESGVDAQTGAFIDDYIKVDSRSHAGGALAFDEDGALYVSIGDGTSFNYADPRSVSVQDVNSLSGKILRIDPETGLGLGDNPFVEPGDDLSSNSAKVYQLGLRNPFSMGFDQDGNLLITDTGWIDWEEINTGGPGANFGWPYYEGGDNGQLLETRGYRDLPEAQAFYNAVAQGDAEVTAAFRAFSHKSNDPGFQVQSIVGGNVIYDGDQYPDRLKGDYIFSDFTQGEIFAVDSNDRREVDFLFKSDSGRAPVHFTQGPDGAIYYADIVTGTIGRLGITEKDPAPPEPTRYFDQPNQTQFIEGTTSQDQFVIDGRSDDYAWGVTDARDGHVVYGATGSDLLYGFETIEFSNETITLPPIAASGGLTIEDNPNRNEFLTGTADKDVFVLEGAASAYGWGRTDDGASTVVWRGSQFDILTDFDELQFNDRTVDISLPDPGAPLVVSDDPEITQYLEGTDGVDQFIVDGNLEDYGVGPTEDGADVIVWRDDRFDILGNFEDVVFNNGTVKIEDLVS